ncbi:uncharacterized protein I303_107096 [Kwoniella dejecticola CBS 10117]|uniref:Uncharacterized protein n=1 Tax=Kwoniella dejecticola CBS 10117 TaxID=1296121 RepID=A0A1A5ZYQ9_9TREE|nr:uncharacterized protein I303_06497 [Kwoniella dejecticola CBS 10117]OBR82939.1 hypothetical protein I303_06497 [Kwoniella dejecticola CBS 10117]
MQITNNANTDAAQATVASKEDIAPSSDRAGSITPSTELENTELHNNNTSVPNEEGPELGHRDDIATQFAHMSLYIPYLRFHPYSPPAGERHPQPSPPRSQEQVGETPQDPPPRRHHQHHHGLPRGGPGSFDDPRLQFDLPPYYPGRHRGRFSFPPPSSEHGRHGHSRFQGPPPPPGFEGEFEPFFFGPFPHPPHGRGMGRPGRGRGAPARDHHHKPNGPHGPRNHRKHRQDKPSRDDEPEKVTSPPRQSDIDEAVADEVISLSSKSQYESVSESDSEPLPEDQSYGHGPHRYHRGPPRGMIGGRGRGGMGVGGGRGRGGQFPSFPMPGHHFEHHFHFHGHGHGRGQGPLNPDSEIGFGPDFAPEYGCSGGFGGRGMPPFGRRAPPPPPPFDFDEEHNLRFMGGRGPHGIFGRHGGPGVPPPFSEFDEPHMRREGHHGVPHHHSRQGPPPFDMPHGMRGRGGHARGRGGFGFPGGFGNSMPIFA